MPKDIERLGELCEYGRMERYLDELPKAIKEERSKNSVKVFSRNACFYME